MHSKVHSMRVCFVRPRNFPAMSIFFPPCQHLLCEAAGISYQRTDNVSLTKRSQPAGLSNLRLGVFIVKGLLCEIQARRQTSYIHTGKLHVYGTTYRTTLEERPLLQFLKIY